MQAMVVAGRGEAGSWARGWWGWVLVAGLLGLAWWNRFIQDDAFISMRYAAQAASGQGLVFNPGEAVQGYTNFLWTVLLIVPHVLGWDAVVYAHGLSLGALGGSLLLSWRLSERLFARRGLALVTVLLLGTNYSFSAWGTGGLETQLQTMLFLLALTIGVERARGSWGGVWVLVGLSFVVAAAVMNRLDGVLLVGPIVVMVLLAELKGVNDRGGSGVMRMAALLGPGAVVGALWLGWTYQTYGHVLPNTFFVKGEGGGSWVRGPYYVGVFFVSYMLLPLALLHVVHVRRLWVELGGFVGVMLYFPMLLWLGYVVWVGGDFMEFRKLVVVMPLVYLLLTWSLFEVAGTWRWRAVGAGVLIGFSAVHAWTFTDSPLSRGMESVQQLEARLENARTGWVDLGMQLNEDLEAAEQVHVALTPAGAIAYYSEAQVLDMLGLNDAWVARYGADLSDRPGHQVIAPVGYLERQGVDLVLGHPQPALEEAGERGYYEAGELAGMFLTRERMIEQVPGDWSVVEIPLDGEHAVVGFYASEHEQIERLIERGHWRELGWEEVQGERRQ